MFLRISSIRTVWNACSTKGHHILPCAAVNVFIYSYGSVRCGYCWFLTVRCGACRFFYNLRVRYNAVFFEAKSYGAVNRTEPHRIVRKNTRWKALIITIPISAWCINIFTQENSREETILARYSILHLTKYFEALFYVVACLRRSDSRWRRRNSFVIIKCNSARHPSRTQEWFIPACDSFGRRFISSNDRPKAATLSGNNLVGAVAYESNLDVNHGRSRFVDE